MECGVAGVEKLRYRRLVWQLGLEKGQGKPGAQNEINIEPVGFPNLLSGFVFIYSYSFF